MTTDYTPEFLASALYAYMENFEVYQEDLSKYDDDTGDLTGSFVARHVFVGSEIPSIAGFSVKIKIPVKRLQVLYNSKVTTHPEDEWVVAVDIFKAFMETTIASAAAFDLINASFAKAMMKQWLGWQTDAVVVETGETKQIAPTEAASRIHSILQAAVEKKRNVVAEIPAPAKEKPLNVPHETKRRPRKVEKNANNKN